MLHATVTAIATWASQTSLSSFVMNDPRVWPTLEILHFIGLSLLIGIAGLFDLRLIGFFRSLPVAAVHKLMPWAIAGFLLNLASGLLFFVGTPFQYVDNPAFYYKMGFVLLAGINALLFEKLVSRRTLSVEAGALAPTTARLIGAASLFSWLSVLYWGRMLAFFGDAF